MNFVIRIGSFYFLSAVVLGVTNPEEFVNLLAGSFTDGSRFSTGNTLPLVGLPWGFNHWSPQTRDDNRGTGSWWFGGNDHVLTWLRCTHQPSPWMGDWGWFVFGPQIGGVDRNPHHFWEPRGAILKPYLLDTTVAPHNIRIALTPTMHGSFLQITFPARHIEKRVCFAEAEWTGHDSSWITGRAHQVSHERMIISNFGLHIRIESPKSQSVENQGDLICLRYPDDASVVEVRIATSLISAGQAELNLHRELPENKNFEEITTEAKQVWHRLMKRVNVVDVGELTESASKNLIIFYTGLYRALTFPRRIDEVNAKGEIVHYSPYDPHGGVFAGPAVTDNGFWDTYRTVYPMLSLLFPDHLGTIIEGWLNAFREGGWLPSWASPGYRNCMGGSFADVVVSDAVVKGVPGFSLDAAQNALLKDAFEEVPRFSGGAVGKEGLQEYISRGYFASDQGSDQVSKTLDFGFADYATAQAFKKLAANKAPGSIEEKSLLQKAAELLKRSDRAYTSLFDAQRQLMVPKNAMGQHPFHFSDVEWGNGYMEGNAWHHSFPPYAIEGLQKLFGGKDKLLQKLHELLSTSGNFQVGSYHQEIHEMTEARAQAMGQYSHNNQPCHHILYLFALLGDRETTEVQVREVMHRAYGVDFFAGDEDNGEQGAWFVLSALGLYSTTPGTPAYVLGSPVFRHVRIDRTYEKDIPEKDRKFLDIVALGTSSTAIRVNQVQLNDAVLSGPTVDDGQLQQDAVLRFVMEAEVAGGKKLQQWVRPVAEKTDTKNSIDEEVIQLKKELKESQAKNDEANQKLSALLRKDAQRDFEAPNRLQPGNPLEHVNSGAGRPSISLSDLPLIVLLLTLAGVISMVVMAARLVARLRVFGGPGILLGLYRPSWIGNGKADAYVV